MATVRSAYPLTPLTVATMVTCPLVTAVAMPVEPLIVPTFGFRLVHVNCFPFKVFPLASKAWAMKVCVPPATAIVAPEGDTATEAAEDGTILLELQKLLLGVDGCASAQRGGFGLMMPV